MAWLSTLQGNGKTEDMAVYYALWIGSIKRSQLSGCHGLINNLCFYIETMLDQSVYICRSLTAKDQKTKRIIAKPWMKWGANHRWIWTIFVDFTSQLKTGVSTVERIYLIYGILENAKTCLYGNKADDKFETNPITVIFCYCSAMKICETLNKHSCFHQCYKMILK